MISSHIVKAFDNDLAEIENLVTEMGGLVETQVAEATVALLSRDGELSDRVRASDKKVDSLELEINEKVINTLALRQPMADDLRSLITALKVSASLERIGDLAKNIAKRTTVLEQMPNVWPSSGSLKRMSSLVQEMIGEVITAYVTRDIVAADRQRLRDAEVDQIHNTLFRELLTYMWEDPRSITASMHMLFIAKNIERMGDHVTGIAEQVHYLVSGSMPDDDRPKEDATSTLLVHPAGHLDSDLGKES